MAKKGDAQFRTKCIYCGLGTHSKEHVFGKRLAPLLPPGQKKWTHSTVWYDDAGRVTSKQVKVRDGNYFGRTIKGACVPCNNVWMARIYDAAFPLIAKLIDGELWRFQPEESLKLAAWAVLFTMTYEYGDPLGGGIAETERKKFYQDKSIPPGWSIAFGRLDKVGNWANGVAHMKPGAIKSPIDGEWYPTITLAYSIGRLLVLVAKTIPRYFLSDTMLKHHGLCRVWPMFGNDISPELPLLDDYRAELVAHSFKLFPLPLMFEGRW